MLNSVLSVYRKASSLDLQGLRWLFFMAFMVSAMAGAAPEGNVASTDRAARETLRLGLASTAKDFLAKEKSELARALEAVGFTLELVDLPAERALHDAAAGLLDGNFVHSREAAKAYPSLLSIGGPILEIDVLVWVKASRSCPSRVSELASLSTAGMLGHSVLELHEHARMSRRFEVTSVMAAARMLVAERIDYLALGQIAVFGLPQFKSGDIKPCFDDPLLTISFYSFLHRKHINKLPAIEAALNEIRRRESQKP